jgi:hypothetical protein
MPSLCLNINIFFLYTKDKKKEGEEKERKDVFIPLIYIN